MKFSTKGRYALRLMVELAGYEPEQQVSLKVIAAHQQISLKYLEQIITPLSRAGFVKAGRGSQGGYRLARPMTEITAGDILRAVEGSLAPVPCLDTEDNPCPRCSGCHTLPFWEGLDKAISDYVDSITLEELYRQCMADPATSL